MLLHRRYADLTMGYPTAPRDLGLLTGLAARAEVKKGGSSAWVSPYQLSCSTDTRLLQPGGTASTSLALAARGADGCQGALEEDSTHSSSLDSCGPQQGLT